MPRLDEPRKVERGLAVRIGVVRGERQGQRVVQPDRQPDDLGVARRHEKAERGIVQRAHGPFPVLLVSVQLAEIAARPLAHPPAAGKPAVRAVGQGHIAAVEALPDELALVTLAVKRPDWPREPIVAVTRLAQDLRHLRVARMDVDEAGHVEFGFREFPLEELAAQRHVPDDCLGFVEGIVVVGDGSGRDSHATQLAKLLEFGEHLGLQLSCPVDALELDVYEPLEVLVPVHDLDSTLIDQCRSLPVPRFGCKPREVIVAIRDQQDLSARDLAPNLFVGIRLGIAGLSGCLGCSTQQRDHAKKVATVNRHTHQPTAASKPRWRKHRSRRTSHGRNSGCDHEWHHRPTRRSRESAAPRPGGAC